MFGDAIKVLNKTLLLSPNNPSYTRQLNAAYLMKKNAANNNAMRALTLVSPYFNYVFSAAYKRYTDYALGSITIRNESSVDLQNVKVNFYVKGLMDFPTSKTIENLKAKTSIDVPLFASFNNSLLDIDEDMGVQTEISAEYYFAGQPHIEKKIQTVTVYGKNAMLWSNLDMVGAFVTPKDQVLNDFSRQSVNAFKHKKNALNDKVNKAMVIFETLHAMGVKYQVDPNNPYSKLGEQQIDSVQFPRETLKVRSGDCDDLSILMAAALENIGIRTAILDVPGHLLLMFNTGIRASEKSRVSSNDALLAIIDDQVWVPLEATLIASTFSEAWAEGARKYHLYSKASKLKAMKLSEAWKNYSPVTLSAVKFRVDLPAIEQLQDLVQREWELLTVQAVDRLIHPYQQMLVLDPDDTNIRMQVAIILAQNGLYGRSEKELDRLLSRDVNNVAAMNNMGNVKYLQQGYDDSIRWYQKAFDISQDNAYILVNIALVYYKKGDVHKASELFNQALLMDADVGEKYKAFATLIH